MRSYPGTCKSSSINAGCWSLKRLPESVVIVGDGATGTPMAMIFSAFGIKVKLFEASHRLLAREDATISQLMTEAFSKRGIEVTCGIGGIESIEKE